MMTPWGYEVTSLDPIVSKADFNTMTGSAYANNPRLEAALSAASAAIRNYCGWHVSPSVSCTAYPEVDGNLLKLPAGYVSAVTSITENGEQLDSAAYEWRRDGLVRKVFPDRWSRKWGSISAVYTAGYTPSACPDLVEAVRAITEGVLAVSAGVTSESADGVTISYAANASSIAAGLTASQRANLAPYKVVNAHAT